MADSEDYHVPVLRDEVLEMLVTDPDGVYVDGTLGGGGHSRAIVEKLSGRGKLFGIDQDPEALARCAEWARSHRGRVELVRSNFSRIADVLEEHGQGPVNGILLDLGVSSRQLDEGERGFSFMRPGPLDMRMNPDAGVPASDLINNLSEKELFKIFRTYGEEPRARRIAKAVVTERKTAPFTTTQALAALIERTLGRRSGKHPATKAFQGLRIAVNRELEVLESFLEVFVDLLVPGGRVAIISYHSLEDRMVKRKLRSLEPHCICPRENPRCTCGEPGTMEAVVRKSIKPGPEEVKRNPRARSAHLRVAQKLPA